MILRLPTFPSRLWGTVRPSIRLKAMFRRLARQRLRDSDIAILALAAVLGLMIGLMVVGLQAALATAHRYLFGLPLEGHLSTGQVPDLWRILVVPVAGGLVYGLAAALVRRLRMHEVVDPIEANALFGGRMSLRDSVSLTLMNLLSVSVGASVGMEAAYTQTASGLASRAGQVFRLRRGDLRILVGCGAAAAIAAAFNAPLAGAFYAFELIIGSYTLAALAPVGVAAVASTLVSRGLFGGDPMFFVPSVFNVGGIEYVAAIVVGLLCALIGIVAMRSVSHVESGFRLLRVPRWARPALAGLLLAGAAMGAPQVMGSGHGAIQMVVDGRFSWPVLLMLVIAKMVATSLCIGSGFRGGMFSSSLFLGSLIGGAVGALGALLIPGLEGDAVVFTMVGMGATGAAVVGAPITMVLLVLEMTGSYPATLAVMVAVVVSVVAVRHWFGYSFSTWRFHIRGVRLQGGQDIGWVRDLTVGQIQRRDPVTVPAAMTGAELDHQFPPGAVRYLFVQDEEGLFLGVIETAAMRLNPAFGPEVHASALLRPSQAFLFAAQPVREALGVFDREAVEMLPVVDGARTRRLVGFVTEAYALRRYTAALERQRNQEMGSSDLFGPVEFNKEN